MANIISKIKTPDNTEYSLKDSYKSGIYTVIGTQTAATGTWTGALHGVSALYDGLTIMYYLPQAGSGNATLNLTLDDGTTTGAVNCYYSSGRLTTHYGKGCNIVMTYWSAGSIKVDGTATTDNRWIANANYTDGNSIAYVVTNYYNRFKAGPNKVFPYTIIMQCADGRWESIVTSSSTGTSKARNTHGFRLGQIALMYANATINENNNLPDGNQVYEHKTDLIDHRYSFNTANNSTNGLTASTPVYLVGSLNATDGLFYLDTKWWTQTLPSSEDGKLYIYLGDAYDYYRMTFRMQHPIYHYLNGMIREYTQSATTTVAQRQKDSGNVNFPVLFANDNVSIETDQVNGVFKSKKVYINPETGNLVATQLNGTTIPNPPKFTDTDTKVRQTLSTTNKNYPLLLSYAESSSTTANIDNVSYRNNSIYANPSTGTITATKLVGDISGGTGMTSSQVTGALGYTPYNSTNPNGYEANQNAFSNVKVGSTTVAADTKTDTLELVASDNITLTPDATNDKVTIAAANDKVTQTYTTTGDNAYLLLSGSASASTTTEGVRKSGQLSQRLNDMVVSSTGGQESRVAKTDGSSGQDIAKLDSSHIQLIDQADNTGTYNYHSSLSSNDLLLMDHSQSDILTNVSSTAIYTTGEIIGRKYSIQDKVNSTSSTMFWTDLTTGAFNTSNTVKDSILNWTMAGYSSGGKVGTNYTLNIPKSDVSGVREFKLVVRYQATQNYHYSHVFIISPREFEGTSALTTTQILSGGNYYSSSYYSSFGVAISQSSSNYTFLWDASWAAVKEGSTATGTKNMSMQVFWR